MSNRTPEVACSSDAATPQTSQTDSLPANCSNLMKSNISHANEHNASTTTSATLSTAHSVVESILKMSGRGRTRIEGDSYHIRLAIMIILRAYKTRQVDNEFDFAVAMEVEAAGKFDDILYHYSSPRLGTGNLFIQAKHKQNAGSKIEEDGLCSAWNSRSSCSIPMFFVSFIEIDQKLPKDARYVLCNNRGLHDKVKGYFKEIIIHQQNAYLNFCTSIGATCFQFDWDKPFPTLIAALQDSCLDKLGKEFAQLVFGDKVINFNDVMLFNIFAKLIDDCIEPLEEESSDSVRLYKFTEAFFDDKTKTTEKVRTAFEKEWEELCKRKRQASDNKKTNELIKIKIQIDKGSFISAKNTQDHIKFDEKVRDFYSKFLLVCNSFNEENLRQAAISLLPQWCNAEQGTVLDKLQGELLEAMKTKQRTPLDLRFWQNYFIRLDLTQKLNNTKHFSNEYHESVHQEHPHIEVLPQRLKVSKLYEFLKDEFNSGIYEFNSTLTLTVSSRIVVQTLSLLKQATIFVDSIRYSTKQAMMNILDDLLMYLSDVNHPTIKAITILGKHRCSESVDEIKQLTEKYCQKIIVLEQLSGRSQNEEFFEKIQVKDLSDAALRQLYTQKELKMFGTTTPLSSIVNDTDDLSLLLNVLELCDQTKEIHNCELNVHNYEKIQNWYIQRHFVSYKPNGTEQEGSYLDNLCNLSVRKILISDEKESNAPGLGDSGDGKVYIFLNDAGLGKTTYFTWLAWRLSTFDLSRYVIKFIAREYSTDFERLQGRNVQNLADTQIVRKLYCYIHLTLFVPSINKRTIDETDVVRSEAERCAELLEFSNGQILLDATKNYELSAKELYELRLFQEKFNSRNIVLILDGFDEIAPYYKDEVMKCFGRFASLDGVRSLYLSSRPYGFEEELKENFDQCRFYRLKPFSGEDIIRSFDIYLCTNLDDYKNYETKHRYDILEKLYEVLILALKDIITVPLLLYMVQVVLLPEIKRRVNNNHHTISRHILDQTNAMQIDKLFVVEKFIEKKLQILVVDKTGMTDAAGMTAAARTIEARLKKELKEQHMLLAMYVIFNKNDRDKLLTDKEQELADEIMKEVNEGDEKMGIVLGVQHREPQFLHRSFAEYFAACWLYENWEWLKSEKIFHSPTFWTYSLKETREFFDRRILRESDGCDLHLALMNGSDNMFAEIRHSQFEDMLHDNPSAISARDKVGRLPLHLVEYKPHRTMKWILERTPPELINEKDELCGWNALDYAFILNMGDLIEILFNGNVRPDMDNLFDQVCSNDLAVLLVKGNEYVNILNDRLKQAELAQVFSERVAKYLIAEKQFDIHAPLAELDSFSVLEKVVTMNNLPMFRQLVTKSGPDALALDNRVNRLLRLLLQEKYDNIKSYLVEHHPSTLSIINDNRDLFISSAKAIENNQIDLFKTIFGQFCINQNIECVEEDTFINEVETQDENELFEIEIPFEDDCCYESSNDDQYFNIEGLLSIAIHYGNTQIVSYILQKTKMVVTVEFVKTILQQLRIHRHLTGNHKKCMPAFKYLFSQIVDLYAVDEERENLFLMFIKIGCVYMLHSLFTAGLDPKKINVLIGLDEDECFVFRQCLKTLNEKCSANICVYLQQRSIMDCFDTFGPTGESIFEFTIDIERFIVAQALVEEKFRNLSYLDKEIAVLFLLHDLSSKYYKKLISDFIQSLLKESSTEGEMDNNLWHSIYSSADKQRPFNKFHLVEQFVERKLQILISDKSGMSDSTVKMIQAKNNEDQWRKQHMLLAIYVIFNKNDRDKLLTDKEQERAHKIMKEVNEGDEKMEIVVGVQHGEPQFLHRSFAEYFAACWLYENWEWLKSEKIFHSPTFWTYSLKETREFFDRRILRESDGCDLHLALMKNSEQEIDEILSNNPSAITARDKQKMPANMYVYLQQRSIVDCFNSFGPTGESIFDLAITNDNVIVSQALVEDKFRNLSST
ncbi:uncharacterized protein LOC128302855 [Anopheles moucheti]|uniref:uncharacterized protein LOC128302855 n=1 Tax=Anopheles moucheti TaxID=186751 RepID=UPI0022F109DC|nr:uncharacterized protein LOC128302855 [Anopheles moucheti]